MSRAGHNRVDHRWIAAHVPHQGRMCLLEAVQDWDAQSIQCRATSHRDPQHPLRSHGRLGSACLIEYAAQAIALHGALLQGPHALSPSPAAGLLASARGVELHCADLAGIDLDLCIRAARQHGDARGALYDFEVRAGARLLASGRISIVLGVARPGAGV